MEKPSEPIAPDSGAAEPEAPEAAAAEPPVLDLPIFPAATEEVIDPDRSRVAILCVLLVMLTMGAFTAIDSLTPLVVEWVRRVNPSALAKAEVRTSLNFLTVLLVPAVLCLAYMIWAGLMAYQIFRNGEFPPRGYPILVPTRVKHGAAARREGWLFIGFLLVGAGLIAYLVWAWLDMLKILRGLF